MKNNLLEIKWHPSLNGAPKEIPLCPVFGICGGCEYQDIPYPEELKIKEDYLKRLLKEAIDLDEKKVHSIVPSPMPYFYRNRLDLKIVKTRNDKVVMGFSPHKNHEFGVVDLDVCSIAQREISMKLPQIKKEASEKLIHNKRRANIVVRSDDSRRVFWGGIGKGTLHLESKDYLYTEIGGRKIHYSLDSFFQANISILPKLIEDINRLNIWHDKTTFYDLYGGVGLFTLCLVGNYSKAYLIEENVQSITLARYNMKYHSLQNVDIHAGKVEECLINIAQESEKENVVMIDPPRSGISETVRTYLSKSKSFDHLIYLSCNPVALAYDLKKFINEGWQLECVQPYDFFPQTKHIETLVLLRGPRL